MEREAAHGSDSLTEEAVVVAYHRDLVASKIHHPNFLVGKATRDQRSVVVNLSDDVKYMHLITAQIGTMTGT